MKPQFVRRGVMLAGALGALISTPAHALSTNEQNLAIDCYNNNFYTVSNGVGNYVSDTSTRAYPGRGNFWTMAEKFEVLEDAYDRSGNSAYKGMVNELYNGFVSVNGTDWSWNAYNDDICWACIACIRAYRITGNSTYLNTAVNNYNMMWNRAYDTNLGGGLWWSTAKTSKNACVEGPGAIVAALLYEEGQGSTYLSRAQSILSWEISKLYQSNGVISDNITSGGVVQGGATSYNQGTFIGACDLVDMCQNNKQYDGYAVNVANFVKNSMTGSHIAGILNDSYGFNEPNADWAGFNGIFARWMCKWVNDSGHTEYISWLQQNAQAAWDYRNSSGITWGHWWERTTDASGLTSWECSNAVAMTQAVPLGGPVANGVHQLTPACATGSRLDDSAAGTSNGNKVQIWQSNGTAAQQWNFSNVGASTYNIAVNIGPYCLDDMGGSQGTQAAVWSCNGGTNQRWTTNPVAGGFALTNGNGLCLDVSGSGTANGTKVQSWPCNATNAQTWAIN